MKIYLTTKYIKRCDHPINISFISVALRVDVEDV